METEPSAKRTHFLSHHFHIRIDFIQGATPSWSVLLNGISAIMNLIYFISKYEWLHFAAINEQVRVQGESFKMRVCVL